MEKFGGYKTEAKCIVEHMVMLALRTMVKEGKHFEIYVKLRQDLEMETYLHGPRDYAKMLKVRFRGRALDLPETRKTVGWRRTWMHISRLAK